MSLINEALKRTRDAAYQPVHPSPVSAPEYVIQSDGDSARSKLVLRGAAFAIVLALVGALGFALRIHTSSRSVKVDRASTAGNAPAGSKPTAAAFHPPRVPEPAPAPDPKVSEEQIVAKVIEKIKAEQPAAPAMPKLVLQGITYAQNDSEAMINGLTVHVGEDVEGARVVTIESRRVKLDFNGHEITLRLP